MGACTVFVFTCVGLQVCTDVDGDGFTMYSCKLDKPIGIASVRSLSPVCTMLLWHLRDRRCEPPAGRSKQTAGLEPAEWRTPELVPS